MWTSHSEEKLSSLRYSNASSVSRKKAVYVIQICAAGEIFGFQALYGQKISLEMVSDGQNVSL